MKTILTNCTVIDCTGKPPMKDTTVVVEDDRIAELKPGTHQQPPREGQRVFDLEGGYVLPGLWDVHVHLSDISPDSKHLMETESPIDYAIRAGRNTMDALGSGIRGRSLTCLASISTPNRMGDTMPCGSTFPAVCRTSLSKVSAG